MRLNRLKQRILHTFTHGKIDVESPYTHTLRYYSNLLDSSDRLLFSHPDPATSATSPASSADDIHELGTGTTACRRTSNESTSKNTSTSIRLPRDQVGEKERDFSAQRARQSTAPLAPAELLACMYCTRSLESYEFPRYLPTRTCEHGNETCLYCLHNSVYTAFERGGWNEVKCLTCGEDMTEEEALRLVLLWEEEEEGHESVMEP
jgi:hypothetical protein